MNNSMNKHKQSGGTSCGGAFVMSALPSIMSGQALTSLTAIPTAEEGDTARWNWFVENEKKLSEMIQPKTSEDANELTAFINEGTSLISDNLYYNLSVDNEFSFSVEGWPDLFILYPYIISRMPDCLKSRWKFNPFNKGTDKAFGFRQHSELISLTDAVSATSSANIEE